jgi:hypothetical protein
LRRPSGDIRTLMSNVPLLSGCHRCWAAIIVGPPLSLGCYRRRAAIAVGLPLLLGRHRHWAAIIVGLPSLSSCHRLRAAMVVGLLSPPRSLGLPPNGLFLLGYIIALFSWDAFKRPVRRHRAVVVVLFLLVRPIVCVPG